MRCAFSSLAAVLVALLHVSARADAQTQEPNVVEFLPSADHRALRSDGSLAVTGYALEVYRQGDPRLVLTVSLGKPDPAEDGLVHARLDEYAAMRLAQESALEARVVAVGPDGTAASPLSNLFVFSGCAYVFPGSALVPADGGRLTINVRAPAGCEWTATARDRWLEPGLPSSRGTGSVAIVAEANGQREPRVGVVTIGSHVILILQASGAGLSSQSRRHDGVRVADRRAGRTPAATRRAGDAPGFPPGHAQRDNGWSAVITSPVTTAAAVNR